jgi:hypothetical protein
MTSPEMLGRAALVRTDVSEEPSAFLIRVTRIDEIESTLALSSNRRALNFSLCRACFQSCVDLWTFPLVNCYIFLLPAYRRVNPKLHTC